jgi:hypothetical protein
MVFANSRLLERKAGDRFVQTMSWNRPYQHKVRPDVRLEEGRSGRMTRRIVTAIPEITGGPMEPGKV